jgi:ribosomal protein S18 acetylase RimI-like enzyme
MFAEAITLRFATEADRFFLRQLFLVCRQGEFASLGEPIATQLTESQFEASSRDLADRFDRAGDHIIECEGQPVGRLWVHCQGEEWELVDQAVLPEFRCRGIAGVLLRDLKTQAEANNATIRLHVRANNAPAQRLYFRLGFSIEPSDGLDLRMALRPSIMTQQHMEAFRRSVLSDPQLWDQLSGVSKDGFVDACAQAAQSRSFELDALDVRNALHAAKSAWLMRWV